MKLSICVLCLLLATAESVSFSAQTTYLSGIPVCGSFYGFTRTFPNAQQFLTDYSGKGWKISNTGPCPPVSACKVYNPVCGVSSAGKYQTFFNSCLMQADQKITGTAWQIKSLGICSYNPSYISAAPSSTAYATKLAAGMLKYIAALPSTPVAEVVATDSEQPASEAAATSEQPAAPLLDSSSSVTFTVSVPEQVVTNSSESSSVTVFQESSSASTSSSSSSACQQTTAEIPTGASISQPWLSAPITRYQTTNYAPTNSYQSSAILENPTEAAQSPNVTSPQSTEPQTPSGSVSFVHVPRTTTKLTAPTSTSSQPTASASTTPDKITIPAKFYEQLVRLYLIAVAKGKIPAAGVSYDQSYLKTMAQ